MQLKSVFYSACATLLVCNSLLQARTWTNKEGKQIEAELLSVSESAVTLKFNGKDVEVTFDKLSEADVTFARGEAKRLAHLALTTAKAPSRWPDKVQGPTSFKLKEEKSKAGEGKIYKTEHFRFISEVALDDQALEQVGKLYEGTWTAVRALPLPIPRVRRSSTDFDARLFKDMDSYHRNGGPQGSAGVFTSSIAQTGKRISEKDIKDDKTMVPFPSMGISIDGKLQGQMQSHTLAHEITHQLTCGIFAGVTWINEGMAEYIGYTPYDGKQFDFSGTYNAIRQAGMRYEGNLTLPYTLEQFLDMSQQDFYAGMAHRNYTLAAMMVAYFVHLDEANGIDSFVEYMKELQRPGSDVKKAQKRLLGKRSYDQLGDDFCKAWEAKGVKVSFSK